MPKRILVDATHIEETRVVILENGRVAEFDSETSIKKQLKGNIYLAKITRVEPSLQAAFVEYGGDKHGFLPFSEIHPDYYDLPVADKKALLEAIRDKEAEEEEHNADTEDKHDIEEQKADEDAGDHEADPVAEVDVIAGDDEDSHEPKSQNLYKKYKIQEVIKRNQILLVQVEKEERGNKGASLTTFLSLAGRYCVLMPNSLRRGGVSRRIDSFEDRKKLKAIIKDLKIPDETGLIVRTAGAKKDAASIKADYDYLAHLWNEIRQKTLDSTAPAFIHAEGDIIKRTVRDLYNEQIDELLIEGKEAFETAREFMKVVMKEHTAKVKQYKNKVPIFSRYKVEEQIAALYDQQVPLESGGALVINPTEALISIDVNSGRSTSQRNVEETALNTNLEAAYEVARQLRLRDLSGLIVIDFIDMMELKNKKAVERALKEAFQDDRAKLQIGRISSFGLLEMSRQRLRASFLEINTMVCQHCHGSGTVKATESTAVTVLRAIENDVSRGSRAEAVEVHVASDVAIYILNNKRYQLSEIEKRYEVRVIIHVDESSAKDGFYIEKIENYEEEIDARKAAEFEKKNRERPNKPALNKNRYNDIQSDNSAEVIDFAKKSKNQPQRPDRNRGKEDSESFGVSSIFGGLWRKIVD